MTLLKTKLQIISVLSFILIANISYAQQGHVVINQDQDLSKLLALKKEMNLSENDSDRYKIQIYSGDRSGAEKAKSSFNNAFYPLPSVLKYETPNYKVWVGNFRSRLEADRALVKVKKSFPDAFRFKPKKEKE